MAVRTNAAIVPADGDIIAVYAVCGLCTGKVDTTANKPISVLARAGPRLRSTLSAAERRGSAALSGLKVRAVAQHGRAVSKCGGAANHAQRNSQPKDGGSKL